MAYVEPVTRAAGYVIPASEWAQNTVDNPIALKALIDATGAMYPCHGRLTLTTAVPVTTADVTAATTIYFALLGGDQIGLHDGASTWTDETFAELSIAVPATTSQVYDVFVYNNAGTPTLELSAAWTTPGSARFASGPYATLLPTQNGVSVKSTNGTAIDSTRRYVGSFGTTTVSGQTEDSFAKRLVWNYYHRADRPMRVLDTTASWAYTVSVWRQARATATNQLEFVIGVSEDLVEARVSIQVKNTTGTNVGIGVAIGLDSTSAIATGADAGVTRSGPAQFDTLAGVYRGFTGIGRHTLVWLERSEATGTTTWFGSGFDAFGPTAYGITGHLKG